MSQRPTAKWFAYKILYLIVFWVVAGSVLLYVAGYRVNWRTGRVNPSSSISLATYQRQKLVVNYSLNGDRRTGTLPLIINWLTPGYYTVQVSAAGRQPWQRTINLTDSTAANFDNILLVPNDLTPRPATSSEQATLARISRLVSPDLLLDDNELYDLRGERPQLIIRLSQPIEQAVWFPRHTHLVIRLGQQVYLLEADGTNQTPLFTVSTTDPLKLTVTAGGSTILVDEPTGALAYELF